MAPTMAASIRPNAIWASSPRMMGLASFIVLFASPYSAIADMPAKIDNGIGFAPAKQKKHATYISYLGHGRKLKGTVLEPRPAAGSHPVGTQRSCIGNS